MVADAIPQLMLQKSLIRQEQKPTLRDTWVLGRLHVSDQASALLLGAPSIPVQPCSKTGNNKQLANILLVIKRLHYIIPKYMRNHSQITRPA